MALVEFAIIAPLLFAVLFGIIEFGWAFHQDLNTRHGARETARIAAVNYRTNAGSVGDTQREEIIAEGCRRLSPDSFTDVGIQLTLVDGSDPGSTTGDIGDTVRVRVEGQLDTLTGFFDVILAGKDLTSTVEVRLEQKATFTATSGVQACP